jgi:hypothetical protein
MADTCKSEQASSSGLSEGFSELVSDFKEARRNFIQIAWVEKNTEEIYLMQMYLKGFLLYPSAKMRGSAYLTYILYILNFLVEGARSIATVLILDTHILKKRGIKRRHLLFSLV